MVEVEPRFIDDNKIYVAIDAAVESKVCGLRIDLFRLAVVDTHAERRALFNTLGDACAEGRIAAVVMRYELAVDIHVGGRVDALEFEVYVLVGLDVGLVQNALEVERGAEIVASAVLTVDAVPGVGQVERRAVRGRFALGVYGPAVVDTGHLSHSFVFPLGGLPLGIVRGQLPSMCSLSSSSIRLYAR